MSDGKNSTDVEGENLQAMRLAWPIEDAGHSVVADKLDCRSIPYPFVTGVVSILLDRLPGSAADPQALPGQDPARLDCRLLHYNNTACDSAIEVRAAVPALPQQTG